MQTALDSRGFRVFCVPEAATLMMKGGATLDIAKLSWDFQVQMQTSLFKTQTALEDIFINIATNESQETGRPAVVFCDRGVLDGSAYVSEELWAQIMDEQDFENNIRDKRYDAVIHMVTAAEGAEEFYDYGNEARYEDVP